MSIDYSKSDKLIQKSLRNTRKTIEELNTDTFDESEHIYSQEEIVCAMSNYKRKLINNILRKIDAVYNEIETIDDEFEQINDINFTNQRTTNIYRNFYEYDKIPEKFADNEVNEEYRQTRMRNRRNGVDKSATPGQSPVGVDNVNRRNRANRFAPIKRSLCGEIEIDNETDNESNNKYKRHRRYY